MRKMMSQASLVLLSLALLLGLHALDFVDFKETSGEGFEVFSPLHRFGLSKHSQRDGLLPPPERFVKEMTLRFVQLDMMVNDTLVPHKSPLERAQQAYVDFLLNFVLGLSFGDSERSIDAQLGREKLQAKALNASQRLQGEEFPLLGLTMVGKLRLRSIEKLLAAIRGSGLTGMVVETGVWRGGVDIFVRGILHAYHLANVPVLLCDSFRGLPPGKTAYHAKDVGWDNTPYLEVDARLVAQNFVQAGLMDDHVLFAKGFFNDSMPAVAKQVQRISLLRLDGDMYESTVDVIYHLYDKVVVGGFVIMDDWVDFPAQDAIRQFFECHRHFPEVIPVDSSSVYWRKHEDVRIQYWRYQQKKFKA